MIFATFFFSSHLLAWITWINIREGPNGKSFKSNELFCRRRSEVNFECEKLNLNNLLPLVLAPPNWLKNGENRIQWKVVPNLKSF